MTRKSGAKDCNKYMHMGPSGTHGSVLMGTSYCKDPEVIKAFGLEVVHIEEIPYGHLTNDMVGFCEYCPMNTSRKGRGTTEGLRKAFESYKGRLDSKRALKTHNNHRPGTGKPLKRDDDTKPLENLPF